MRGRWWLRRIIINPLAVGSAALATFVIGGLWYSLLFARAWQSASGITDEPLKTGVARVFIGSFLLALVMAASLAAFIGSEGVVFGAVAGFTVGLTWVAAAWGVNSLFERRSFVLCSSRPL